MGSAIFGVRSTAGWFGTHQRTALDPDALQAAAYRLDLLEASGFLAFASHRYFRQIFQYFRHPNVSDTHICGEDRLRGIFISGGDCPVLYLCRVKAIFGCLILHPRNATAGSAPQNLSVPGAKRSLCQAISSWAPQLADAARRRRTDRRSRPPCRAGPGIPRPAASPGAEVPRP
jgi:hypothetical protein